MSNINDKIRQIAKETEPELIRIRRELHQYPELGIDLPKTHEIISRELHKIPGLKIREHAAGGYGQLPYHRAQKLGLCPAGRRQRIHHRHPQWSGAPSSPDPS